MRRVRVVLLVAAAVAAFIAVVQPAVAAAEPRWLRHVERFPGGISAGVRAMGSPAAAAARARHLAVSQLAPVAPGLQNVQMNDDSLPAAAAERDSRSLTASDNPLVAVAASNDYVSGGVAVMRTADGGRSWQTTRVTPQFNGTRDFC